MLIDQTRAAEELKEMLSAFCKVYEAYRPQLVLIKQGEHYEIKASFDEVENPDQVQLITIVPTPGAGKVITFSDGKTMTLDQAVMNDFTRLQGRGIVYSRFYRAFNQKFHTWLREGRAMDASVKNITPASLQGKVLTYKGRQYYIYGITRTISKYCIVCRRAYPTGEIRRITIETVLSGSLS